MIECPACHEPHDDGARFCGKCGAAMPESDTTPDPLLGAVVGGRFKILSILGEGGMGRVYTAEQKMGTSVRPVAVKTLLAEYARDEQVVARFMRECGTVSELEHPNTIKVYDFGQTPSGDLYIAMELLKGQSLEAALAAGGPMPPERVDRILGQVCGSLQEAHDKGIVHRDLKPPNIFLTTRGAEPDYVKVLDFGIAKRDERVSKNEKKLTVQGTVLGTPPYMSPEQFKGGDIDHRSDIYSLGVVAYEMVTGRLPFEAESAWQWATQHITAQPAPIEETPAGAAAPPKLRAAIMRALEKDPGQRPQSARAFFEELTIGTPLPRYSLPSGSGASIAAGQPGLGASGTVPSMPAHVGASGTQPGAPLIIMPGPTPEPAPATRTIDDEAKTAPMPRPPARATRAQAAAEARSGPSGGTVALVALLAIAGGALGSYLVLFRQPAEPAGELDAAAPPPPTEEPAGPADAPEPPPTASASSGPGPVYTYRPPPRDAGADASSDAGARDAGADAAQDAGLDAGRDAGPDGGRDAGPPLVDAGTDAGPVPTTSASAQPSAGCANAESQAKRGDVVGAVATYRSSCSGPTKGATASIIGAAALAKVVGHRCRAKADAEAAASIGQSAALKALPPHCLNQPVPPPTPTVTGPPTPSVRPSVRPPRR